MSIAVSKIGTAALFITILNKRNLHTFSRHLSTRQSRHDYKRKITPRVHPDGSRRKITVGMATRTIIPREPRNLTGHHPFPLKRQGHITRQIDMRTPTVGIPDHTLFGKPGGNLLADLETIHTYRRPNISLDTAQIRTEPGHLTQTFSHDSADRTTPACMEGGGDSGIGINEDYGNAISRRNANRHLI